MKVSNSQIGCFKACRRMYELKYIHGLEPVDQPETISRGLSYHAAIERLVKGEPLDSELDPKVRAMIKVFQNRFNLDFEEVEKWFEYQTASGHTVIGRVDGVTERGEVVEHKTTSSLIDGSYFQRLETDEQIPTYMLGMDIDTIYYTVCAAPSIRQKKGETEEEFIERCVAWYDDESSGKKFDVVELKRSLDDLREFAEEQDAVIKEMATCKLFYRNPSHCYKWGRLCEYAPICKHYDPTMEYIEYKRRERDEDRKA